MMRWAFAAMVVVLGAGPAEAQPQTPVAPQPQAVVVVKSPAVQSEPSSWIGVGLRSGGGARGVPLASIYPGTPAAAAGLLAGDEIAAVNGRRVTANTELIDAVKGYAAGETVKLLVFRDGKGKRIAVRLAQKPSRSEFAQRQLIDKPAPLLDTSSTRGGAGTLAALRGDVVIAALVSTHCPSCAASLRALERLRRERGHGNLRVVGIGMASPLAMRALGRRLGLGFPFLVGLSAADATAYGWSDTGEPLLIVIDAGGIVRYAGTVDALIRPGEVLREARILVDRAALVADRLLGRRPLRPARSTR